MRFIIILPLLFILSGCNSSKYDNDTPLAEIARDEAAKRGFEPLPSLDESQLSDFNFQGDPDYVEHRLQFIPTVDEANDIMILQEFDSQIKSELTESQRFLLSDTTSENGYKGGCLPANCVYYLVALEGESVTLIDTRTGLQNFIGTVDTPAELHFLAGLNAFPKYFKATDNGYEIVVIWSDCNGGSGVDIYHVTTAGDVIFEKTVYERTENIMC